MTSERTIHAGCVAIHGIGVLVTGESGAGKSDLVLRLIDRGATLVSDDRCLIDATAEGPPIASPPDALAGLIEVRGIGVVTVDHLASAPVQLLVELIANPPRMPDERDSVEVAGKRVPRVRIAPFEASAPIKVELALRSLSD